MTIKQISASTIKVSLSAEELASYHVAFGILDNDEPETRRLFSSLLTEIEAVCGRTLKSERLFVEAFARGDGGCLLYLSVLEESKDDSSDSESGLLLLKADSDQLQSLSLLGIEILNRSTEASALYENGDCYCLVLRPKAEESRRLEQFLREFGSVYRGNSLLCAYTVEHCPCLIPKEAVKALSHLFRAAGEQPPANPAL